ncbi:MAG: hypothetical protein EOP10_07320 [Proteobacteria bacterium]|nr:MAG: hypothetical protein EOP10_07320 [Pseudomonadota bacterium]
MYPPTVQAAASQGALVEISFGLYFRVFSFLSRPNSMVACLTAPRFEQTYLSIQISARHL